jgi:hypothetical protein
VDNNLAMHIPITPLQPTRSFTGDATLGDTTVGDYWLWAYSDIIGNTNRGMLAQFIVARALGDTRPALDTWAPYDVVAHDGTKVPLHTSSHGARSVTLASPLASPRPLSGIRPRGIGLAQTKSDNLTPMYSRSWRRRTRPRSTLSTSVNGSSTSSRHRC